MKILVVIPARGGSKGLPGKNIKLLNEKPLIQYTIEAARELFDDSCIYVSTDDEKIRKTVEGLGIKVPFLRPDELATDTANSRDVLLHAIDFFKNKNGFEPECLILLQPTSPFRNALHIKEALKTYTSDLDMVVSVKETESNPYYVLFEENVDGFLKKSKEGDFTRRQDCPKVWEYNGAIYIINTSSLREKKMGEFDKILKYEMDSIESTDIDNELDWATAKVIMRYKKNKTTDED